MFGTVGRVYCVVLCWLVAENKLRFGAEVQYRCASCLPKVLWARQVLWHVVGGLKSVRHSKCTMMTVRKGRVRKEAGHPDSRWSAHLYVNTLGTVLSTCSI